MAKKMTKAKKAIKRAAKQRTPVKKGAKAKRTSVRKVVSKAVRKPKAKAATPRGFAPVSITPGFTVNDAQASVAWYRDVLGFAVKQRWENEGQFLGAEMTSGPVTINIGQDDWKLGRDRVKGQGTRMYVQTGPEIDRFAARVKANGGTLEHDPRDEWGMRAFSVIDPDGYKLTFWTNSKK